MRPPVLVLLFLLSLLGPALADPQAPQADGQGDFVAATRHEYWEVVDPDPEGLAGRRHDRLPPDFDGASWPDRRFQDWPAVRRFKKGTVLVLEYGVASPVLDEAGKPWLVVWRLNHHDQGLFLVRAHSGLVRPIRHPLPEPNESGDYFGRTQQRAWRVVDPDPDGLEGRLSPDFPENWMDLRARWPEMSVLDWPVVAHFPPGAILTAVHGNLGAIMSRDPEGRAWLMVQKPRGGVCFVRANRRYVQPVASEKDL